MRKPRPATYNPAQALNLIASDRTGSPLSCPSCSGAIERTPNECPAGAALSRDAEVLRVRTRRSLYRRRCLNDICLRRSPSRSSDLSSELTRSAESLAAVGCTVRLTAPSSCTKLALTA